MFGRLGFGELVLILGIALVIFGPSKLPQIGKAMGQAIGEFKNSQKPTVVEEKKQEENQKTE